MNTEPIYVNDIVQVIDKSHAWYSTILTVSKVDAFGINGYIHIPITGNADCHISYRSIRKVGRAVISLKKMPEQYEDEDILPSGLSIYSSPVQTYEAVD